MFELRTLPRCKVTKGFCAPCLHVLMVSAGTKNTAMTCKSQDCIELDVFLTNPLHCVVMDNDKIL